MNDARKKTGVLDLDPALKHLRVPANDLCWWCGDVATTEEHRFKASTLRRVARSDDGTIVPSTVYKKSSDYEGTLQSLKKGTQIRWRKNLCANCNNAKSQPFDRSYDHFESFLVEHIDEISARERLDWQAVYGLDWKEQARNLARYFGKQLGCMLATQELQIPEELIEFLDGFERCPSVCFMLYVNPRAVEAHEMMRRDGFEDGLNSFVGLLEADVYQSAGEFSGIDYVYHISAGEFSGIDYVYHIGFLWFTARWRAGADVTSWFEYQEIDLPRVSADD
ncbi:hypothetical protein AS189_15725 [Arthrobacter alpinus]|uniref:Uncharacterized protein n=1 Tax=Arthrobacter alpinus TaxID=656366 RepID=A0A0S2M200_9MICC|nr:hypothetical protein [Arthrobacter alpinus]ALO67662.1 hypothetical protein AS189_15725 [Arthrobacter alpinus]